MRLYKFIKTKNPKLICKLTKKYGGDLHAIETIVFAWILIEEGKYKGIIGVNRWRKDFATIDLFVACDSHNKNKMMQELIDYLISKAKADYIRRIYCHMGEEKINYFFKRGFIVIKERDLPKDYICSCHLCSDFLKTCHPKPIMLVNINQ